MTDWVKYPREVLQRGHVLNDEEVRLMTDEIERLRAAMKDAELALRLISKSGAGAGQKERLRKAITNKDLAKLAEMKAEHGVISDHKSREVMSVANALRTAYRQGED